MTSSVDLKFEAPGPGTWMLDTQHFPTPLTRFIAEIMPSTIASTWRVTAARDGGFGLRTGAAINGFMYSRMHMVGAEPGSSDPPSINHPEVRERVTRAVERIREKYWEKLRREWFENVKPDSIQINLDLATVNVTQLGRAALFQHLSACRDNSFKMCSRHHTFNAAAMIPTALLLADLAEWTDLPTEDVLSLLDGSTPISAGITPELEGLAAAINDDATAKSLIRSNTDPAGIMAQLLEMTGAVGDAMNRFWFIDGHRLATGFDVSDKNAFELPEMLLENVRNSVEKGNTETQDRTAQAEALARFVRGRIPPEHRSTFDEELVGARASIRVKDERGLYNDIWANGISRKALIEAGRRLVDEGRLHDREHFMEADWEEIQAIWSGSSSPTADDLAKRRETRMSLTFRDAPPFLGPPPSRPAAIEGLPPEIIRLTSAMAHVASTMATMGMGAPSSDSEDLVGVTASKGDYEGTARVVVGDYSFDRIQSGDVLVTSTHSEAFNAVVQRLGAIIADTGGLLSHLSIVSREIGIPCIVTCKNATVLIKDGDRVRLDGETGRVTILD